MNIPALGCEEVPDHLREQASQQDQLGGKPESRIKTWNLTSDAVGGFQIGDRQRSFLKLNYRPSNGSVRGRSPSG